MPENQFNSLGSIYKFLSPQDLVPVTPTDGAATQPQTLLENMYSLFLDPVGNFFDWVSIQEKLSAYANSTEKPAYFLIGDSVIDLNKEVKYASKKYWGNYTSAKELAGIQGKGEYSDQKLTVLVSRDPLLTPAARGSSHSDFFLNHMPSIFASQMVPYLAVEIQTVNGSGVYKGKYSVKSPSIIRFLAGAGQEGSSALPALSEAEKAMLQVIESPSEKPLPEFGKGIGDPLANGANSTPQKQKYVPNIDFSGMEMYLMPQTLTNMDGLQAGSGRVSRVKPFTPFASIDGLTVNVTNAGAGAMVSKRATLNLTLHDKQRLSEIQSLVKPGRDLTETYIWTTYGWLAPRGRGPDDAYAKFINENMLMMDCWQVTNTNFNFDASGQVKVTLELFTSKYGAIQRNPITFRDNNLVALFNKLDAISARAKTLLETLPEGYDYALGADLRFREVLGSTSVGRFPQLKATADQVAGLLASLRGSAAGDDGFNKQIDQLATDLEDIRVKSERGKDISSFEESLRSKIAMSVRDRFQACAKEDDPFLAPAPKQQKDSLGDKRGVFYETDLRKTVAERANIGVELSNPNTKSPVFERPDNKVVSFGKLFLSFVAPCILSNVGCSELQVMFYSLNDRCGPVSSMSIAEFPLDLERVVYAHDKLLEESNSTELTIEQFLSLVINSQFEDNAALAYGMSGLYKKNDPTKTGTESGAKPAKDAKQFQSGLNDWFKTYHSLVRPQIGMIIETNARRGGSAGGVSNLVDSLSRSAKDIVSTSRSDAGGDFKFITRIHIYDKQQTPYKAAQSIVNAGEYWENGVPSINPEIRRKIEDLADESLKSKKPYKKLADFKTAVETALTPTVFQEKPVLIDIKQNGVAKIRINRGDRKAIKDFIAATVPSITLGTNGTMITSAQVSSKTDGTQAAINIVRSNLGKSPSNLSGTPENPIERPGGLPLTLLPASITLTSAGCPTAQLYQQYFIDFDTGTTLDNLYTCTSIAHSFTPGKFTTNWTFMFTDGYGKFSGPPSATSILDNTVKDVFSQKFQKK